MSDSARDGVSPDFEISKWYFDCITDAGAVFIGYIASLRFSGITVKYSAITFSDVHGITEKSGFVRSRYPLLNEDTIEFNILNGKAQGTWQLLSSPIIETLYNTENGKVEWACLQPRSKCTLLLNQKLFTGTGYAEKITITCKPWDIPLSELCWGRAHTPSDTIVWIFWKGIHPLNNLWVNGKLIQNAECNNKGVFWETNYLIFTDPVSLKKRTFFEIIRRSKVLSLFIPTKYRNSIEHKMTAGISANINSENKSGKSIHEVVIFG